MTTLTALHISVLTAGSCLHVLSNLQATFRVRTIRHHLLWWELWYWTAIFPETPAPPGNALPQVLLPPRLALLFKLEKIFIWWDISARFKHVFHITFSTPSKLADHASFRMTKQVYDAFSFTSNLLNLCPHWGHRLYNTPLIHPLLTSYMYQQFWYRWWCKTSGNFWPSSCCIQSP